MHPDPPPDDDRTVMAPAGRLRPEPESSSIGGQNALPAGTKLEEFELEKPIGEGGFSIVYLAHDLSLRRKVAIKEYLPSALAARKGDMTVNVIAERYRETFEAGLASFIKEAETLAQFDHPSLVKVFRFWRANGTAYMAMPYYEGPTLKEALRRLGRPPDETWLRGILGPVMDAIEVLHAENYLHRDIAPDNILLLQGNRPVLLDFGAARRAITDMSQAFTVILKPGYAPIEQYAEASAMRQGPWTDCYALASVSYLAITGKPPAPAVERIVSDSLVPLSKCAAGRYSARFLQAIDTAMAVRPEGRPQSIAEFRKLLGMSPGGSANRQNDKDVAEGGPRRRWMLLGLGAMLLVIVGALAVVGTEHFADIKRRIAALLPSTPAATSTATAPSTLTETPTTTPTATPTATPKATTKATATPTPTTTYSQTGKPFTPIDVLDLLYEGRDPSQIVTASPNSPKIPINGKLRIKVKSSTAGYLYLFLLDGESRLYLIYPAKTDPQTLLEPSTEFRFPPWDQTGVPGNIDQYLLIVTQVPHAFGPPKWRVADDLAELPMAIAAKLFGTREWSAKTFLGTPTCPPSVTDCSKSYGAARFTVEAIEPSGVPAK